jgi:uncharacterized membrane protein YheB (UPF0754 family)
MQTDSLKNELFDKKEIEGYSRALDRLQNNLPEESFNKHEELTRLRSRLNEVDKNHVNTESSKASSRLNSVALVSVFRKFMAEFLPVHAIAMTLLMALCISVSMNTYFYMSNSSSKKIDEMSVVFRGSPGLKSIDTSLLKQDWTFTLSSEDPNALLNSLFAAANEGGLNFYHEILPGKNHIYIFAVDPDNVKQTSFKQLAGLDNNVSGTVLIEINQSN